MKLSIAMMIKNEEKNLKRTLDALKKLSEIIDVEIVIIDNGSTDNSVKIAKEYTEEVYFEEWKDDFSYMRNKSIERCTGDYILILDADEELIDIEKLADFVNKDKLGNCNSGFIRIIDKDLDIEKSLSHGNENVIRRMFRSGKVSYEGRIHEQPVCVGSSKNTDIRFLHYGYDSTDYSLMEYKYKRNLELLFKDLKEKPNDIYTNFQISASYHMHNNINEALKYIEIAYELMDKKEIGNLYVIQKYCEILYQVKNYKKLKEISTIGFKIEKEFADFYFYLGLSYREDRDFKRSINYLESFIKYNKFNISYKIANLSCRLKKFEEFIYIVLAESYHKINLKEKSLENILKIKNKSVVKSNMELILKIINDYNIYNLNMFNEFMDEEIYNFILDYMTNNKNKSIKDIDEKLLEGKIKEIIFILKRTKYKKEDNIDRDVINLIKNVIKRDNFVCNFYLEVILENDIKDINLFKKFNHEEIAKKINDICKSKYSILASIVEYIEKISEEDLNEINFKLSIIKALMLSGKLNEEKSNELFKEFIALKYYLISKFYEKNIIENYFELIDKEDRFIIEIKRALSIKFKDQLKYIKEISRINKEYKIYLTPLKFLINEKFEGKEENIELLETVKININIILENEKYQEAYDIVDEIIRLVGFDFDLYIVKYDLLNKFGYYDEANKLLKEIILYSDVKDLEKFL